MKTLYTFMLKHTVVVLLIIFATGLTITINHLNELAEIQVKETALENAKAFTNVLSEFRSLYTSEVVIAAKNNGLLITHDYKKKLNAIPLPATLTILLSEHLSSQEPGVQSKLYSPFPFPWRLPTGGLRDKFSQNAWESLQNNAERLYFNVETIGTSR